MRCSFFTPGDGMELTTKQKYLSAAGLLLVATAAVKVIGAVYKIPLTGLIGAPDGAISLRLIRCLCRCMPSHWCFSRCVVRW